MMSHNRFDLRQDIIAPTVDFAEQHMDSTGESGRKLVKS